jgi:signal transduction histidine kinase
VFPSVRELGIFDTYVHAMQTGSPVKIDVPYFDEKGVAGSFEVVASPTKEGLIIAAVDVSETRQAQEALRVLNAELQARVSERTADLTRAEAAARALEAELMQAERLQSVGQLTSSIAHDFKNLLGTIIAYAERAHEISTDREMSQVVGEIEDAAKRADHLAGDLLSFGGRARARPETVDINALVAKVMDLLRVSMGGGAEVRFEPCAAALPAVRADPLRLEQVLLNLALNAREAMPDGGTLTIRTCPAHFHHDRARRPKGIGSGRYVELTVSDTGIGMSPEVRSRIFERFFTTKAEGTGAGLGLSTVHGIIADAGGVIEVDSREGEGTAFRIFLPAAGQPTSRRSLRTSGRVNLRRTILHPRKGTASSNRSSRLAVTCGKASQPTHLRASQRPTVFPAAGRACSMRRGGPMAPGVILISRLPCRRSMAWPCRSTP